jgi:hypothetical protein
MKILGKPLTFSAATIALGLMVWDNPASGTAISTIGVFDEQLSQLNTIERAAETGSGQGSPIKFDHESDYDIADFTTSVSSAYGNDLGGVIDFETTLTATPSLEVSYGVSASKVLNIAFYTSAGPGNPRNILVPNSIAGITTPISGTRVLGQTSNQGFMGLEFSGTTLPVEWGVTLLSRSAARTTTVKVILDNNEEFTFDAISSTASSTGGDDVFIGYRAPEGRAVARIEFDESAFTLYDDFGFVVTPPGDYNGDGNVDGLDFGVWQSNFPTAGGAFRDEGDADGDGDVDGADFVVWQANFPFPASQNVSSVPEPSSGVGTVSIATALCYLGWKNRSRLREKSPRNRKRRLNVLS